MPYKCKGICDTFEPKAPFLHKYPLGFKRCSTCMGFFKIFELRCPCCSTKLRTKSRYRGIK
ncbi:MAG: hypothetical protein HKP26_07115 [Nitrosopumilus sp.]|nr:hypothetical protein [Nitrosopumilus sp.]